MLLGLKNLCKDLSITSKVKLMMDSATAKAMAIRRGYGKVRHISLKFLWIQARVHGGDIEVEKVDGPGRQKESLYPVVYVFSGNVQKRDTGPNSGIYG